MREHPKSRHHTGLVTPIRRAVLAVFGVAVLSGCAGEQSALAPAGPFAQAPHDLILIVMGIAAAVLVFVQALIIYSVVKFRTRKDDDGSLPKQVHGNTRLEILWTIIPAVILAVIAAPTVQLVFQTMDEPDDEFMTVQVIGHRWWFEYYYPDYDIYTANELAIPAGTPVRLEMRSGDPGHAQDRAVIHSFWVPRLAGKQDMLPNHTTYLNIQADEPGRFIGQCAEYCGLSHVNMRARVEALSAQDFDAWVAKQQTAAVVPTAGTLQAQGRDLFHNLGDRQACATCHQVWEGDSQRRPAVGPDLTHLMSRKEFIGAIENLDEPTLRQWLKDPDSIKPMQYETNGIGMPNLNLTEGELDALVAYLLTLG